MPARISLAGRIAVSVDGHRLDERALPGGQPRLVLSLLVRERHRPVPREELAENVWPHRRPQTWETALRGVVSRARQFLVTAGLGDSDVVHASNGSYRTQLPADLQVDLEQAACDVDHAEHALEVGDPSDARVLAERARAVLQRPLLPALDTPWLEEQRAEMSVLRLRATETLAEARLELGDFTHATAAAEEAIELDPFRESAHRLLMVAHVRAGNRASGLWAYERCRRDLAEHLGVDPAPATQALHAEMLRTEGITSPPTRTLVVERPPSRPSNGSNGSGRCPYRGLRTFMERDADYFFGRSADISRILERLDDENFLAVLGPSGSGKSSLVRAGVVPSLRRGALAGSDTWSIRVLRPGASPTNALAHELREVGLCLDESVAADQLRDDPRQILRLLAPSRSPILLVLDQFEEVFTLTDDDADRAAFLAALEAATAAPGSGLRVVITMRADFYPRLADFPWFADLASRNQFLVTPMDEVGLAEAVEGPARVAGLNLEIGLTQAILRDVANRPGALPLLGHCLVELWERRVDDCLTLEAYEETGGVEAALARRAESVYRRLSPSDKELARRLLLRLVRADDRGMETRRRVPFSELPTAPEETSSVESVIGLFVDARLLTTGDRGGGRWVEVSHEALIPGWPRFQRWVDDDRAGMLTHHRLANAAKEWARTNRDEGALYRGSHLVEVREWFGRHPGDANTLERDFLESSLALAEDERRGRIRRLRRAAFSLSLAVIVVTALAVTAWLESNRAGAQETVAQSRSIAAAAIGQLAVDPALGLALAIEAVDLAPTREAVAALRQALVTPVPTWELPGGRGDLDVSPDRALAAIVEKDGSARIWDIETGELIHELERLAEPALASPTSFSPDGRSLVTADQEAIRIWDSGTGALVHSLPIEREVFGVAWSDDGQLVATASFDDTLDLWDPHSGERVASPTAPGPVTFVRWAADGAAVLAWSALDPTVYVMDTTTEDVLAVLAHEDVVVDAEVSADGRRAITVGFDGTARLWDVLTGDPIGTVTTRDDRVWSGAFSPDGTHVIVGDDGGTVVIFDVEGSRTLLRATAQSGRVIDAAFSPDGSVAATADTDGTVAVWDVTNARLRGLLRLNGSVAPDVGPSSVKFSPDGDRIVTRAASVQVWDVPTGPDMVLGGHARGIASLGLSADARLLASGGEDGVVNVWNLETGELVHRMDIPETSVSSASFGPDGSTLITANPFHAGMSERDVPPSIWDLTTGDLAGYIAVPAPSRRPCSGVCQTFTAFYTADGAAILTAGQEGVVRLWNSSTRRMTRAFEPSNTSLFHTAASLDARLVAGAGLSSVSIWDTETGDIVHVLDAAGIRVAFDPTGERLAVAGDDGMLTLWETSSGELTGSLRHSSAVNAVAWSPDGRFLLTAAGGAVNLWDVESRQTIHRFPGAARAVAFASNGTIIIGGADGTVGIHTCDVCGTVVELLEAARDMDVRELTPPERERFLGHRGD